MNRQTEPTGNPAKVSSWQGKARKVINPFPVILNTPNPLTTNTPNMRELMYCGDIDD